VAKIENDSTQASVEAVLDLNKPIELCFDAEKVKYYRAFGTLCLALSFLFCFLLFAFLMLLP